MPTCKALRPSGILRLRHKKVSHYKEQAAMTATIGYRNPDEGKCYIGWQGLGGFLEEVGTELTLEV